MACRVYSDGHPRVHSNKDNPKKKRRPGEGRRIAVVSCFGRAGGRGQHTMGRGTRGTRRIGALTWLHRWWVGWLHSLDSEEVGDRRHRTERDQIWIVESRKVVYGMNLGVLGVDRPLAVSSSLV